MSPTPRLQLISHGDLALVCLLQHRRLTLQAPEYEYRNGILDPDYPEWCSTNVNAAITSLHVYQGKQLPAELQGKMMFADRVKGCVWYFDNDKEGRMNRYLINSL